jgi:hypothetical protein
MKPPKFYAGQKVVCISATRFASSHRDVPVKGGVYTVRSRSKPFIQLCEFPDADGIERHWSEDAFAAAEETLSEPVTA